MALRLITGAQEIIDWCGSLAYRSFFLAGEMGGTMNSLQNFIPKHRIPNNIIKKELKKRGISQVQAAFDLEENRTVFSLICSGYHRPQSEVRQKIAAYLNMPEDILFPED